MLPIYIPARNEGEGLRKVVESIRRTCKYANIEPYIVVVNDGSKDNTSEIAKELGCVVVDLPDRGYSALGKPELAETHNAGLQWIRQTVKEDEYDYIMVSGADTIYDEDYMMKVLKFFDDNPDVVITAGVLKGRTPSPLAVTGTGRLYRKSFMKYEMYWKLIPYYSWETFPLYLAQVQGKMIKSVLDAEFTVNNIPHDRTNFTMYGIGMWEGGFIFPYVFGRAFKRVLKRKFKQGFQLMWGRYITANIRRPRKYPNRVRKHIKRYQWKRILRAITFGKMGGL